MVALQRAAGPERTETLQGGISQHISSFCPTESKAFPWMLGLMEQESHPTAEDFGETSAIVGHALMKLQDVVAVAVLRARQTLLQGFTVLSFVLLLLCVAAFLYGSFYYSYMPMATFSTPVHYYYRTDCDSPTSFPCSYPVANVSLLRNKKHVLTFGQVYRIYLQLEMPDSPTNQQVGMFMTKTTCFSQDGGQVAASTRSASQLQKASSSRVGMLRYRSDLLKTLGTLLFLPVFLSGAAEQKQVVEMELFSEYVDDPYSPSVTALIEIMSSKVQIYSSHLYVHAHFTGIRYLLFYFPILSAFVGVFTNFIFLSFLFILSYMRQLWKVGQNPEQVTANRYQPEMMGNTNQLQEEEDAELLGPLQNPGLGGEDPHLPLFKSSELHNGNIAEQSEITDSEVSNEEE
ncbi:seipin isoform X3 [Austrofundulus limnaeus]|uniref:Seipin n=1 Tax=Austrofundulus limnaeus TaxID=52670 RepID=A0A2I4B0W8_AUSLI|nr:PREDICTED: seipin-like isoform X3 [Austrofundulus limnaeus]